MGPRSTGTSPATHHYQVEAVWSGSTALGYEHYDRRHAVTAPTAGTVELSADPSFRGDERLLNPEQLLLAAATSCQLLSFLAVAARARIDVVAYRDAAEAEMAESDRPVRIGRIVLHPVITVRSGPSDERVRQLIEIAHRECYIANSLSSEIEIDAVVRFVDRDEAVETAG